MILPQVWIYPEKKKTLYLTSTKRIYSRAKIWIEPAIRNHMIHDLPRYWLYPVTPLKYWTPPIVWSQWYVVSSQEKPWFLGGVTKKWPEDGMTRLYPYLASPSSVLSSVTGWPLQRDLKNRHPLWIRVFVDLIVSSWNLPFWCIISKIQKEMGMGQSPGTWWTPK